MKNKALNGWIVLAVSIVFLIIGLLLAMVLGVTPIRISDLWQYVMSTDQSLEVMLVRDVRLPRVLAVMLVGGLLGISGALIQGITRNPVAEPSILGVSQGATLMIAALYTLDMAIGTKEAMLAALVGAIISGAIAALLISKSIKQPMAKILLAGTAMSTFYMSITTMLGLISNKSQLIAFWVGGGFRNVVWLDVYLALSVSVLGGIACMKIARSLNVLHLGDDVATGLGIRPQRLRIIAMLIVIPMIAASVAVGKNIAFIGLIVPQMMKRWVGNDYKVLLPLSYLGGALLLTYADIAARLAFAPYEMPIGIFTALIGVPFFMNAAKQEKG